MTISKEILFSDEQDLFCSYSRFFLCLLDCFNMTIMIVELIIVIICDIIALI